MKHKLNTLLKVGVLAASGLMFYSKITSGTLAFYINERFSWLSLVAVLLFMVMALTVAYRLIERQRAEPADAFGTDGAVMQLSAASSTSQTAGHGKTSTAGMLIVAIPAILGLLMPARPLTASAIESRGISMSAPNRPGSTAGSTASNTTQLQRPATTTRNILDWLRTFSISEDLSKFNSQSADVIGFVYKDPRTQENQFWVSRFTVSCCVADAAAIGLLVQSDKVATLKADSWVHVTGKFQLGEFAGEKMPLLIADKIEAVAQPNQPYLYP